MNGIENKLTIDGQVVHFAAGDTILQAATAAGIFIPRLCAHPEFKPHGSCKLCTVVVNGRAGSACTIRAMPGQDVQSDTPELNGRRRRVYELTAKGRRALAERRVEWTLFARGVDAVVGGSR